MASCEKFYFESWINNQYIHLQNKNILATFEFFQRT